MNQRNTVIHFTLILLLLSLVLVPNCRGDNGRINVNIRVLDINGTPIRQGEITIIRILNGTNETSDITNTDPLGRANFTPEAGTYRLFIRLPKYNESLTGNDTIMVNNGSFSYGGKDYRDGGTITFILPISAMDAGCPGPDSVVCCDEASSSSLLCIIAFIIVIIIVIIMAVIAYSRIHGREVLDNVTRNRIMNYINDNPGIHFRAMQRDLDIGMGTLTHHLKTLEREEFIKSQTDGQMKRYYPAGMKVSSIVTPPPRSIVNSFGGVSAASPQRPPDGPSAASTAAIAPTVLSQCLGAIAIPLFPNADARC